MKKIFWGIVLLTFITCIIGGFIEAFTRPETGGWFLWAMFSGLTGFVCFMLTDLWGK